MSITAVATPDRRRYSRRATRCVWTPPCGGGDGPSRRTFTVRGALARRALPGAALGPGDPAPEAHEERKVHGCEEGRQPDRSTEQARPRKKAAGGSGHIQCDLQGESHLVE